MAFHLKAMRYVLSKWDTDVVFFREISTPWMLALRIVRLFKRGRRPAFICDTRSLHMPPGNSVSLRMHLRGIYLKMMLKMANRWSDGRTAITRHMAEEVGIANDKLWGIWASGVDPEPFAAASVKRRWPSKDEPVQIIYVGSLEPERGLLPFSQAVERANALGMNFRLRLVGDGAIRAKLEQFAAGTEGRVCVGPPVPHEQVPDILANAHVGAVPFPDERKFHVSSPIKLFEYMASGLPILASRIICHTDVIGDGNFVFWTDGNDWDMGLAELWRRRESLANMSKGASAHVQGWTWGDAASHLRIALEQGLMKHG
jgi:glycosyltransferase involved in cell wall biosynthesis